MKRKIGIILGSLFVCIALAFLFFVGGRTLMAFVFQDDTREELTDQQDETEKESGKKQEDALKPEDGERTNVLLLGIDARKGEKDSRTDTIILASVDPKLKKAIILSIPRDTRVKLRGSTNQKINAANVYGGPDLVRSTVEELLDIDIDYYVKANFEGFAQIIDILGGIDIDVEQRMYKPSEEIDLQAGEQHLDGKGALAYVRFRDYLMGDIDRTTHQQRMLHAIAETVTQPSTVLKIPKMLDVIMENVETDIPMSKMVQMASWVPLFDASSIVTQTVPGYFLDIRDGYGTLLDSFWEADKAIAGKLLDGLYEGKTYSTVTNTGGKVEISGPVYSQSPGSQSSSDNETSYAQEDPFAGEMMVENTGVPAGEMNESGQEAGGTAGNVPEIPEVTEIPEVEVDPSYLYNQEQTAELLPPVPQESPVPEAPAAGSDGAENTGLEVLY